MLLRLKCKVPGNDQSEGREQKDPIRCQTDLLGALLGLRLNTEFIPIEITW